MSKIIIRQLTGEDISAYRYIRLEMLKNHPEAYGDSYKDNQKQDHDYFLHRIEDGMIFGAFDHNELIGTTGFFVNKGEKSDHTARIWGVYVKPEMRGQGLAYDLLNAALDHLPQGLKLVQLCVVEDNPAAEETYKKAGFTAWGLEEHAIKVGNKFYNEIHMTKFLDK